MNDCLYFFSDIGNSEKRNLSSPIRCGPFVTHVDSLSLSYTVQETAKDINLQQLYATNMSSYIPLQLKGSYLANLQWYKCYSEFYAKVLLNSWFSHNVTKIQTKKLSLLLSFYFHVILEHLKTFIQTNVRFKRFLRFAIQDAWISRLLRDAAFSWRPGKLLCGLKTLRIFGDFAI